MDFASRSAKTTSNPAQNMKSFWIIFAIAVAAVALFVIGLSLTQMIKGHPIDSEIGTNANMQKRGIRCTAGEFRREEEALRQQHPSDPHAPLSTAASCNDCSACLSPCSHPLPNSSTQQAPQHTK